MRGGFVILAVLFLAARLAAAGLAVQSGALRLDGGALRSDALEIGGGATRAGNGTLDVPAASLQGATAPCGEYPAETGTLAFTGSVQFDGAYLCKVNGDEDVDLVLAAGPISGAAAVAVQKDPAAISAQASDPFRGCRRRRCRHRPGPGPAGRFPARRAARRDAAPDRSRRRQRWRRFARLVGICLLHQPHGGPARRRRRRGSVCKPPRTGRRHRSARSGFRLRHRPRGCRRRAPSLLEQRRRQDLRDLCRFRPRRGLHRTGRRPRRRAADEPLDPCRPGAAAVVLPGAHRALPPHPAGSSAGRRKSTPAASPAF